VFVKNPHIFETEPTPLLVPNIEPKPTTHFWREEIQ
jgi:hypothetical protein